MFSEKFGRQRIDTAPIDTDLMQEHGPRASRANLALAVHCTEPPSVRQWEYQLRHGGFRRGGC